jgi:uncharacterized protein (DUF1330 family)
VEYHGGELVAHSHRSLQIIEGSWSPSLLVVHRWPGADAFRAFYDSEDYEPLKRLRHQSAESSIVLLDAAVR